MICDDAAEYISALCDGETISPLAAQHIGACPHCQARLSDYLAMGVELRRAASLGLADAVPSRVWIKPQNRLATWWQKGWGPVRIPRLAFAGLIAGILVLASALAVNKARAQNTGTVVLLTVAGPNGPPSDCPISTENKDQAPYWSWMIGARPVALKVRLLARDGGRVLLAIRTRIYKPGEDMSALTRDADPVARLQEVWFEPGEPLKFDVPEVGTLTLKGEWLDHMPIMGTLDPGPNELRLGRPLLLKDKVVVGDLSSTIGGIYGQDDSGWAMAFYIPGEGRFLLSQLPMKGAVEADVAQGRISFEEGGHSWELVSGVPVCRADHVWVLHEPDSKLKIVGPNGTTCGSNEAGANAAWSVGAARIADRIRTRRERGMSGRGFGTWWRRATCSSRRYQCPRRELWQAFFFSFCLRTPNFSAKRTVWELIRALSFLASCFAWPEIMNTHRAVFLHTSTRLIATSPPTAIILPSNWRASLPRRTA